MILSRFNYLPSQRLDTYMLLASDSFGAFDLRALVSSFSGIDKAYVLRGLQVVSKSGLDVGVSIADSLMYNPQDTNGGFYYGLGSEQDQIVSLPVNQTNIFIEAKFTVKTGASATVGLWDALALTGEDAGGSEYSSAADTEKFIELAITVNTVGFSEGAIPIARASTSTTSVTNLIDCRPLLFRLGSGGSTPDPTNRFPFAPTRQESPSSGTGVGEAVNSPFRSKDSNGILNDKGIQTFKEWADAVMTKLAELGGTSYWYENISSINNVNIFSDALASTFKSKGQWQHSSSTPGLLTWTEDLLIKKTNDPRDIIIRAGNVTIGNEQVAFIRLVRDESFNILDEVTSWTNGANYVNTSTGVAGPFAKLAKGDWVKKIVDNVTLYLRVEEFYDDVNLGGSTTTAANAKSIRLSGSYQGSTGNERGRYEKGIYLSSDVEVVDRNDNLLNQAAGNFHWLAIRSDTIMDMSSIDSFDLVGNIDSADGVSATITVTAHGLQDGDRIEIVSPAGQAGTYVIEVEDANIFTIQTTDTTTGAMTAYYGLATTTSRDNGYGTQLESAAHNFKTDDTVIIDGTTSFDGTYQVSVRSSTQFQFAFGSNQLAETSGTATLAKITVRSEAGASKVIQGESVDVGDLDTANIKQFVGMNSSSETSPLYNIPTSYNTVYGGQNFNSSPSDSLTVRASKLTAMMADRIQDRSSAYFGKTTIRNTTNGANQDISTDEPYIYLHLPGSGPQTIDITSSIPVNSMAVVTINRNVASALTTTIKSMASYQLAENELILFYRLTGNEVYCWDGNLLPPNGTYTVGNIEVSQNKNLIIHNPGVVHFDAGSGLVSFVDNTADIDILVPGGNHTNTIDVSAINTLGTLILPTEDSCVWLRIAREEGAAKTFNTIDTSDPPDTLLNGKLYITGISAVPKDQDVVVLFVRKGNSIIQLKVGMQPEANIYDELLTVVSGAPVDDNEVTGPVTAGTILTLPLDSRDSDTAQTYVVGAGMLTVELNGQVLIEGSDWDPVGTIGSLSDEIEILQDLVIGDVLKFRIAVRAGVFIATVPTGPSGSLQDAYDIGQSITVVTGQPVTINGASGKLLQVNGDVGITGVIDPKGMVFSLEATDPLQLGDNGLWVNSSGDLIHKRGAILSPINMTQLLLNGSSGEANTGSNLGAGGQVFKQKIGVDLQFRSIVAGSGITVTQNANDLTISAAGGGGGEANTASNLGAGSQLFKQKTGVDLQFRSLVAGSGVSLTQNANDITISLSGGSGEANTASNVGSGSGIFKAKSGVDLQFKSIIAGSNVTVTPGTNDITIAATGEANTGSNLGAGSQVFKSKVGTNLQFRSFVAGSGVTITQNADDITIAATGGGGGEVNTASNLGSGSQIFASKVGVDLRFRSLLAGSGITVTQNTNDITIALSGGSGEANTASNVGSGAGIYKTKVGVDLQLKSLVAGTGVTITPNANDITIAASGEANTYSSLGSGTSIVGTKSGVDLRFKSLVAGSNISLSSSSTEVTINSTGGSTVYEYSFTLPAAATLALRLPSVVGLPSGWSLATADTAGEGNFGVDADTLVITWDSGLGTKLAQEITVFQRTNSGPPASQGFLKFNLTAASEQKTNVARTKAAAFLSGKGIHTSKELTVYIKLI